MAGTQIWRWLSAPTAAVPVAAVAAGAFLLGGAIREDGLFGATTAAWVQALGSIGAIWGAVGIAMRQARSDRARERRAQAHARMAARKRDLSILIAAWKLTQSIALRFERAAKVKLDAPGELVAWDALMKGMRAEIESLFNFPIHEIPEPEAVSCFVSVLNNSRVLIMAAHTGGGDPTDTLISRARVWLGVAESVLPHIREGEALLALMARPGWRAVKA